MGGGWWLERAAGGQSDFKYKARPESGPASERGGYAPWPLDSPAGSQESLAEREG